MSDSDASTEWTDGSTDEMLAGEEGSVATGPAADAERRTKDDPESRTDADSIPRPGANVVPRAGVDDGTRAGVDDGTRAGVDDGTRAGVDDGTHVERDDETRAGTDEELADRLAAVERAVGRDPDVRRSDERTALDRVSDVESRLETIERRLDELDAGVQALRGYAGSVRAVEETIERRADLALATARKAAAAVDATEAVEPDGVDDALPTEAAVAAALPSRGEGAADREPVADPQSNGPEGTSGDGVLPRLRDVL